MSAHGEDGLIGAWELASIVSGALVAGWASAWIAGRFGAPPRLRALLIGGAPLVALSARIEAPLPLAMWGWMLGWTLMTLAAIDTATLRLPDALTFPLAALGLVAAWVTREDLAPRAIGLIVGLVAFGLLAGAYARLRGRSGLGGGDVKLLGAAGAWVGWSALPALVLGACGLSVVLLMARALRQGRASLRQPFPFGVALAGATWAIWLSEAGGVLA